MSEQGERTPPPQVPRGWVRHPRERMLITPLVAGIGGLLAFFTVVAIVVWLPIHTFDPPPSSDWAPLSSEAHAGRNLFALERLLRVPFRLLATAGRARRPLLPLSQDLCAG